jgi:hypothetical protein
MKQRLQYTVVSSPFYAGQLIDLGCDHVAGTWSGPQPFPGLTVSLEPWVPRVDEE